MRTDVITCREFDGTGPAVFTLVPVMGAAFSGIAMDQGFGASLFPHSLANGTVDMCDTKKTDGLYCTELEWTGLNSAVLYIESRKYT